MMNNGGSMDAAAVILIMVFIRSCTVLEPSIGIIISGMTIRNWIHAARAGTPFSFSSTVFLPKMPSGISEKKIFTGVAVHISREPNIAVKDTRPTKRFINASGRPKYAAMPWNTCTDPPVNFNSLLLTKTLISTEETEYSTPIKIPARMITLTNDFEPPLTSLTYTATDSAPPAAIKIQVVTPRNAQLKLGIIASTVIGSAGCTPPTSAVPASKM